jgi:hypothetical protein
MMTSVALWLYAVLPFATTSAWLGALICLAQRAARIFTTQRRYYDLMAGVLCLLIVNRLWYQGGGYVFGRHVEVRSLNEIIWGDSAQFWSIVCAVCLIMTFRWYECDHARRR